MLAFLNSLPEWIGKVIDALKSFLAGLYIARSTRIESEKNALEKANEAKTEQIDIAARPPLGAGDLRDKLRRDEF